MQRRTLLIGAFAGAVAIVACDKQPAGPAVDRTPANTGAVIATVLSDASNTGTPNFTAASGITVNLYRVSDTVNVLRRVTTDATGRVMFVGLDPGDYIVRPALRPLTTFTGRLADTITVTASDTLVADTIRVRFGSRVTGNISSTFISQTGPVTARYGDVIVRFYRETAVTGVFEVAPFALDTTDASGTYDVPVSPAPQRVRVVFSAPQLPDDTLTLNGRSVVEIPRGEDTLTTGGVAPNATVTSNAQYRYPNAISGRVFRDLDADGVYDGAGENLVSGDQVALVLRSATDETLEPLLISGNITSSNVTTYFQSLVPGRYALTLDPVNTRFPSNPFAWRNDTVFVTVPSKIGTVTADFPVPFR